MTLREMIIERIHYAMDEENLAELYSVNGDDLEHLARDVRDTADAKRGIVEFAGVGFGVGDEFCDGLCRH